MRLSLLQIAVTTAALAAWMASAVVYRATCEQIDAHVDASLLARAEVYADVAMTAANQGSDPHAIHRRIHAMASHRDVLDVAVLARSPLTVVGSTRQQALGRRIDAVDPLARLGFRLNSDLEAQHVFDPREKVFHFALPFRLSNLNDSTLLSRPDRPVPGLVYVRIDASDTMLSAGKQRRALLLAVLGTVAFALVLGLGMMFHHVLWPLRRLEKAMNERLDGLGSHSPPPMPNRELRQLASSVWSTFDDLQRADQHMRAIVDGATDAIMTIDGRGTIVQYNP